MKHQPRSRACSVDVALLLELVASIAVVAIGALDGAFALWREREKRCTEFATGTLISDEWYDLLEHLEEKVSAADPEMQDVAARRLLAMAAAYLLDARSRATGLAELCAAFTDDGPTRLSAVLTAAGAEAETAAAVLLQGSRAEDLIGFLERALLPSTQPTTTVQVVQVKSVNSGDSGAAGRDLEVLSRLRSAFDPGMAVLGAQPVGFTVREVGVSGDLSRNLLDAAQQNLREARTQLRDTLDFIVDLTVRSGRSRRWQAVPAATEVDVVPVLIEAGAMSGALLGGIRREEITRFIAPTPMVRIGVWAGRGAGDELTSPWSPPMPTALQCGSGKTASAMAAARALTDGVLWDFEPFPVHEHHDFLCRTSLTYFVLCTAELPRSGSMVYVEGGRGAEMDGGKETEARRLVELADEMCRQRRFPAAIASYRTARSKFREISDRRGESDALHGSAEALRQLGRLDEAERAVKEAARLAEMVGGVLIRP